ncbi:MAG: nicotinamide mononucleotide transporter [Chloroflexaceae bacterium]|nr:nicotinamide mononucleotide transporter [Chloroflexaceae bacterium]
MNWIEIIATIFGALCVWLTVRQHILCWPTGLVQVVLYIVVFYEAKLYSDMLLHIIYVAMQCYGWYAWLYGGTARSTLPVTRLKHGHLAGWVVVVLAGTAGLGYVMSTRTDAALPYPDGFTTVASLVAQWLLARKKLESWYFWIAVDVVAIGVYLAKALYFTTGLYLLFLVLATMGLVAWRNAWRAAPVEGVEGGAV